jgi:hypothetical protein
VTAQFKLGTNFLAGSQIDAWRGRCLNRFAEVEAISGSALEAAYASGKASRPGQFGGQRLAALLKLAEEHFGREPSRRAFRAAVKEWKVVEARRAFLAHGIATYLADNKSRWHAFFDFTIYSRTGPRAERWALSQSEADVFEAELSRTARTLSHEIEKLKSLLRA